jgi:hypothetical protein
VDRQRRATSKATSALPPLPAKTSVSVSFVSTCTMGCVSSIATVV